MSPADSSNRPTANFEQHHAWDGDEGAFWADHADRFDRSVAGYLEPFMAGVAVRPADDVLDVGCGAGQIVCEAARIAAAGRALGLDLSSRMVELARRRAANDGLPNVRFELGDAQVYPFEPESFDLAVSRNGIMFFEDPVVAFRNIREALRPGGRIAMQTWQPVSRNEWISEFLSAMADGREIALPPPDAPGPFALSDPDRVSSILTAAGYFDIRFEELSAPMWFGNEAEDAETFILGFSAWRLEGFDEQARDRARAALRRTILAHTTPHGVCFGSCAWLIRASRA